MKKFIQSAVVDFERILKIVKISKKFTRHFGEILSTFCDNFKLIIGILGLTSWVLVQRKSKATGTHIVSTIQRSSKASQDNWGKFCESLTRPQNYKLRKIPAKDSSAMEEPLKHATGDLSMAPELALGILQDTHFPGARIKKTTRNGRPVWQDKGQQWRLE